MSDKNGNEFDWGRPKQDDRRELSFMEKWIGPKENFSKSDTFLQGLVEKILVWPVEWFHDSILEKTRVPEYPWYHRRYRRVPTIDECYFHDYGCR